MNKFLRNMILTFGSITVSIGILCFTGEPAIENIKSKVNLMKEKIILISNDRDAVLRKLNDTILKYDADIKLLNDKKVNLEHKITDLNKKVKDNKNTSDSIIHHDEEIIHQLTTEKENLQAQIEQLTTEKENLQVQIEQLTTEKESLQTQLQAKDNDLTTLQNEILRLNNELEKANNAVADLENYANLKYDEISNIATETNLDNYNTTVSPDFSDNSSNDSNSNENTENAGNTRKFNESNFFFVKDILTLSKTNDHNNIIYTSLPDSATDVNIKVTVSYKGIANQVTSITVDQPKYDFFLQFTNEIKQIKITGSCNISGVTHQFDEVVNVDYN